MCPSGICETPHTRSLFNAILGTPHDIIPHDTRSVPLRLTEKLHNSPEPGHVRQRTHDLPNSISVRGSGAGEHGDERCEKGSFERDAEERWEGCRVDRLQEVKRLCEREDTMGGSTYV